VIRLPKLTLACGLLACMAGAGFAQDEAAKAAAEHARYYHLDYAVKELDGGKLINARHYWTTVEVGSHPACSIRTGSKVPIATSDKDTGFTYIDVGVSIDCSNVQETDGSLAISVAAEISTIAPQGNSKQPLIRQNKWNGKALVPVGKATAIFSSDDVSSKGQIQLELTATPLR